MTCVATGDTPRLMSRLDVGWYNIYPRRYGGVQPPQTFGADRHGESCIDLYLRLKV